MIYVGSRHGTLYALSCYEEEQWLSPQEYESQGDVLQAAYAYALAGDLARAAGLFQREGEYTKAAELYRESGDLGRAAKMYAQAEAFEKAKELYQQAGEPLKLAELHVKLEEYPAAAEIFEQEGEHSRAAKMYERSDQPLKAAEMYQQAGDRLKAAEMYGQAGEPLKAAEIYAELGQHVRAAELYEGVEEYAQAAALYERAGRLSKAAELYVQAGDPTKARKLYHQAGELVKAAELCVDLGLHHEAAQTYERAALIMEKEGEETDTDERQLGELFALAAQNYRLEFDDVRADECRRKAIRYKRLPDIQVSISAEEGFRVLEWKAFCITLSNTGYGVAKDIEFTVSGAFKGDTTGRMSGLRDGDSREFKVAIKPTEAGEQVPLTIKVSYRDPAGELREVEREAFIQVARYREPKSGRFSSIATVKERRESLRCRRQQLVKNLSRLEEQAARYGMAAPLHILNDIEYHKEEIERIKAELSSLEE